VATPADLDFVRELDVASMATSIPHTRAVDAEAVRAAARAAWDDADTRRALAAQYVTLVAEQVGDDGAPRRIGFLRLDLDAVEPSTGEPQGFIQQLAVAPEAWGAGAAQALVRHASALCAERGLRYLVGVVSTSNERTLRVALGALDFEVERYQIVRRCP
jgi:ribosomal protein S18 acetylase RimI-like enzyme